MEIYLHCILMRARRARTGPPIAVRRSFQPDTAAFTRHLWMKALRAAQINRAEIEK
jgi:hypothetical protein